MGFSVSGSAAIIFIGLVVAAGIAIPAVIGSVGSIADAQGEQIDRGIDALNTDFEIETQLIENEDDDDDLEVTLTNTGSTTLSLAKTSVLVDGDIRPGVAGEELWAPGEEITITIDGVPSEGRVKVVVENGIAETTGYGG